MGRYLLDTQPFVLLAQSKELKRIGKRAMRLIQDESSVLLVSAITIVEIVIKNQKGDLYFPLSSVDELIDRLDAEVIPFTKAHAEMLETLPRTEHCDPFDRMIISCALSLDVPLISGDSSFGQYKKLKVIWS